MSIDPASIAGFSFSSNGPSTRADAFFLADYATIENGRVFTGAAFFDHIAVNPADPTARVTVVMVLRTPRSKWGVEQSFKVSMVDADGRDANILTVEGTVTAGGPQDHSDAQQPVIFPVQFAARLGHFDIVLDVDGVRLANIPVHILAQPDQPQG